MAPAAYSEERIVEQPAIALFAELGWRTVNAIEQKFGAGGTLKRETSGEVVLAPRLRAALEKLNPKLPAEAIAAAVEALTRDRTAVTLAGTNRETWTLIKDGVKVQVSDRERGGVKDERVRVVDWENRYRRHTGRRAAPRLYQTKCGALFEHIYESYLGDGSSVYNAAM
jgi:type I restriction enzyme R subunit